MWHARNRPNRARDGTRGPAVANLRIAGNRTIIIILHPFHSIPFQQSHSDLSSSFKFYRDLWWSLCQQWGLTLEPPQHSPKPEVDLISSTLERLSHGKTYFRGNCDSFLFSKKIKKHTLWLFNIAMENGPFIDDFPSCKPPFIGDSPWLCES